MRLDLRWPVVGLLTLAIPAPAAWADGPELLVRSGRSVRQDTPVRVELSAGELGLGALPAVDDPPRGVKLQEVSAAGEAVGAPVVAQVDRPGRGVAEGKLRLTFLLGGKTPAETERRFRLDPATLASGPSPWAFSDPAAGSLTLSRGPAVVFRYNLAPVANPKYTNMTRAAYIHPAYTPSGALITGDFSAAHPHHRGFFLAYTKTRVGTAHPDFWNFQSGTGKVEFDRLEGASVGPLTARFVTRHRWEAAGLGVVLREVWEVEAYDIPGSPYWLFDLTATQRAEGEPLVLVPYRYGGMAYRGADPFLSGPLDVRTSEGLDRVQGDQKPARWVDLTGRLAEGSDHYGGAVVMDHPENPHHPTVARIHPTTLPFFTYTPGHDEPLTIGAAAPTVFRYRVVIHDGRPDASLDERLWRDFAGPPTVEFRGGTPAGAPR